MTAAPFVVPLIPPRARSGNRECGRPTAVRRLPVAVAPEALVVPDDVVYGFGWTDESGRVADRAMTGAGLAARNRLTLTAAAGVIIARREPDGIVVMPSKAVSGDPGAVAGCGPGTGCSSGVLRSVQPTARSSSSRAPRLVSSTNEAAAITTERRSRRNFRMKSRFANVPEMLRMLQAATYCRTPRGLESTDLPAEMPDIVHGDPFPTSMRSLPALPYSEWDRSNPFMPQSARRGSAAQGSEFVVLCAAWPVRLTRNESSSGQ
jgi:hypothetical protein